MFWIVHRRTICSPRRAPLRLHIVAGVADALRLAVLKHPERVGSLSLFAAGGLLNDIRVRAGDETSGMFVRSICMGWQRVPLVLPGGDPESEDIVRVDLWMQFENLACYLAVNVCVGFFRQ